MHPVTFALFFFIFLLCLSASLKRLCLYIDFSLLPVSFFFCCCCWCYMCVLSGGLCVPIRLVRNGLKAPSEECYYVWRSPLSDMCFALFQHFVLLCFSFRLQRSRFNTSHSVAPDTWSFSLFFKQKLAESRCVLH